MQLKITMSTQQVRLFILDNLFEKNWLNWTGNEKHISDMLLTETLPLIHQCRTPEAIEMNIN